MRQKILLRVKAAVKSIINRVTITPRPTPITQPHCPHSHGSATARSAKTSSGHDDVTRRRVSDHGVLPAKDEQTAPRTALSEQDRRDQQHVRSHSGRDEKVAHRGGVFLHALFERFERKTQQEPEKSGREQSIKQGFGPGAGLAAATIHAAAPSASVSTRLSVSVRVKSPTY